MSTFTDEEIDKLQAILNTPLTYFDDLSEVVCPYCGEDQRFDDADSGHYSEDCYDYKCDDCGKTFEMCGSMSWSWSTDKKEVV